jgi:hypothetical protein
MASRRPKEIEERLQTFEETSLVMSFLEAINFFL